MFMYKEHNASKKNVVRLAGSQVIFFFSITNSLHFLSTQYKESHSQKVFSKYLWNSFCILKKGEKDTKKEP